MLLLIYRCGDSPTRGKLHKYIYPIRFAKPGGPAKSVVGVLVGSLQRQSFLRHCLRRLTKAVPTGRGECCPFFRIPGTAVCLLVLCVRIITKRIPTGRGECCPFFPETQKILFYIARNPKNIRYRSRGKADQKSSEIEDFGVPGGSF